METSFQIGLRAIHKGFESAYRNAGEVGRSFRPDSELDAIEPLVNLAQDARSVQAGAAIVRIASDLQRYTLDIIA